jgi:hypothetical protein
MAAPFHGTQDRQSLREEIMSAGKETTGTRDTTYHLVSVLYHARQGAETYEQYVRDAIASSDYEVAAFFREVQEEEKRRADRSKAVLAKVLAARAKASTE